MATPTLILEDGSRPTGANTYISLADAFDVYTPLYAEDPSSFTDYDADLATRSLIKAAKALDDLYGQKYLGYLYPDENQSLLFPRSSFYNNNGRLVKQLQIPVDLKNAQTELALLIYSGQDPYVTKNKEQNILSKSVAVAGAISTSITYTKPVDDEMYTGMLRVERVLAPILKQKQKVTSLHL